MYERRLYYGMAYPSTQTVDPIRERIAELTLCMEAAEPFLEALEMLQELGEDWGFDDTHPFRRTQLLALEGLELVVSKAEHE